MNMPSDADDLRAEYDFTPEQLRQGVRGKYAARYAEGTNLVPLDLTKSALDAPSLAAAAAERGVLIAAMLPRVARLVTHLDVDDDDIDRAIKVLRGLLS